MKTNKLKTLLLILTVWLSAATARAQTLDGSPPPVERISPNAIQISGLTYARFSPDGYWLVLETDAGFYLVPGERFETLVEDFENSRYRYTEGWAREFLPSGRVVFSSRRGLFALDAADGKTQTIYQLTAEDERNGTYPWDSEIIAVSEDLVISGNGDYDTGGEKGHVVRFDVRRARYTRGAQIDGFKNPRLSPGGKYILYEHGNDEDRYAALYDIRRNVNLALAQRFDFKRHFPKYKRVNVKPLIWVAPDKFVAGLDENQFEKFKASKNPLNIPDTPAWLALLDAASGQIVWKKQMSFNAPEFLEQLSASKAAFYNEYGHYEVSLADGRLTKLPDIEGNIFVVSPDKKRTAYINGGQIFVSALDGANKKKAFDLSESWQQNYRSLRWSPDGKLLLVTSEDRLLIIRL